MDRGDDPTAIGLPAAAVNPPDPFPRSTVTVLLPELAVTRSSWPSPLKSAAATKAGDAPTAKGLRAAAVNPPEPLRRRTVTLLPLELAVTRSGLPSRLKSPTATDCGLAPAENGLPVNWAFAAVTASRTRTIFAAPGIPWIWWELVPFVSRFRTFFLKDSHFGVSPPHSGFRFRLPDAGIWPPGYENAVLELSSFTEILNVHKPHGGN